MDPTEEQIALMQSEGNTTQPDITQQPPPNAAPTVDYAKLYENAQQQMAIQQQQLNQLIAQQQALIAAGQQAPIAPQIKADPFEKFDPDTAKALRDFTDNITQQFKQELSARDQQLAELRTSNAFNQIAAASGGAVNPAIIKRAQELYVGLSKKGLPVNADDMYNFAIGEAVRNGTYQPAMRQSAPSVLNGGSRQPQVRARPSNFDQLSYKDQVKIMEQNGELDAEF
jgi:hypothetical protein